MMTLVSVETFQNKDVGSSLGNFIYLQVKISQRDPYFYNYGVGVKRIRICYLFLVSALFFQQPYILVFYLHYYGFHRQCKHVFGQ